MAPIFISVRPCNPNPPLILIFPLPLSLCACSAVTLVMMLLGRTIFQKFGWGTAALITPIMLLATGVAFFSLIIFNGTKPQPFHVSFSHTCVPACGASSCGLLPHI